MILHKQMLIAYNKNDYKQKFAISQKYILKKGCLGKIALYRIILLKIFQ